MTFEVLTKVFYEQSVGYDVVDRDMENEKWFMEHILSEFSQMRKIEKRILQYLSTSL